MWTIKTHYHYLIHLPPPIKMPNKHFLVLFNFMQQDLYFIVNEVHLCRPFVMFRVTWNKQHCEQATVHFTWNLFTIFGDLRVFLYAIEHGRARAYQNKHINLDLSVAIVYSCVYSIWVIPSQVVQCRLLDCFQKNFLSDYVYVLALKNHKKLYFYFTWFNYNSHLFVMAHNKFLLIQLFTETSLSRLRMGLTSWDKNWSLEYIAMYM